MNTTSTDSPSLPPEALHDKATRGETLSADERARLDAWYAAQDREEADLLARDGRPQALNDLRGQVESAVAQLLTVTEQIRAASADNQAVRGEIASLHRELQQKARPPRSQPA